MSGAGINALRSEPVRAEGVVIHFADGTAVVRGGYRSIGSALDGPLGVRPCLSGTPSPGLQLEIEQRGRSVLAAVAAASGPTLVVDGSSLWAAVVNWDPAPELATLQAVRTAGNLVEGPGLAEDQRSNAAEQGGRPLPPPPARPRRPDRRATGSPTAQPPVPEPPDVDASPVWLELIMGSDLVRSGVGRRRISESEIRRILVVLDRHDAGGVTFPVIAAEAGVAERRVPGYLAQLSQIVNIDGYEVITVTEQSARFDRALLERQLQIGR